MMVRPARPLPSVIVGALLVGSLGLGAGSAWAAEDGDPCHVGVLQGEVHGDDCVNALGVVLGSLANAVLGPVVPQAPASATESAPSTPSSAGGAVAGVTEAVGGVLDGVTGTGASGAAGQGAGTPAGTGAAGAANSTPASGDATGGGAPAVGGGAPVAPASAVIPAPDVRGAPVAFAAAGGLATARVPMLSFGPANPALLFAPLGSPLRTLAGQGAGSPVTTSSDVQALAVDGLPGGVGTPTVIAVLVLASLGAFALRHVVLRRVRGDADGS
ncbi:hypothetical protein [Actinomycetospora sp. NBRC 106375]|uniref:hypothetical protein n=1 Tax=Actinomycetospora sp. NBRC 106375 TaxID=3032207 RepID=UPI002555A37D|nr:hypothetical protein [Actinomycetospora sp. NBRC 106375]